MNAAENHLGTLRPYFLLTYVAVFFWSLVVHGIPVDRLAVLLWMFGAFGCASLGRTREQNTQMLRDWALLVVIYMIYDYSRGTADQWASASTTQHYGIWTVLLLLVANQFQECNDVFIRLTM